VRVRHGSPASSRRLAIGTRSRHLIAPFVVGDDRFPGGTMRDEDELKAGIDKPKRGQYVLGVLIIAFIAGVAYWWLGRH
jgi:hypothetical protein